MAAECFDLFLSHRRRLSEENVEVLLEAGASLRLGLKVLGCDATD